MSNTNKRIISIIALVLVASVVLVTVSVHAALPTPAIASIPFGGNPVNQDFMTAGPAYTSINYTEYFAFTSHESNLDDNTQLFEVSGVQPNTKGGSRGAATLWTLSGHYTFKQPVVAKNLPKPYESFAKTWIFSAVSTTNQVKSFRYASFNGGEWEQDRGTVLGENTVLADIFADFSWMVFASTNNKSEVRGFKGSSATPVWSLGVQNVPSEGSAAYAQDLVFLGPNEGHSVIGFVHGGKLFAVDAANGTIYTSAADSCGFTPKSIISIRQTVVTPANGVSFLVVYGELANNDFGVCVVSADIKFSKFWSKTFNKPYQLESGSNSFSLIDVATPATKGANATVTAVLFFALTDLTANPNTHVVEMLNLETGDTLDTVTRQPSERFNMPVALFKDGLVENVLLSSNGRLVALNPVTGTKSVTCATATFTSCANTPAILTRDAKTYRLTCQSSSDASQIFAVDIFNKTQSCYEAWQYTLQGQDPYLAQTQPIFAAQYITEDPFVMFNGFHGELYSLTFRASDEPAPTTAAPAPVYPQPAHHIVTPAFSQLKDPVVFASQVEQYEDGPIVVAISSAEVTYKGKTARMSVPYYQSVSFTGEAQDYEIALYDEKVLFNPPVISLNNAQASEFAVDFASFDGVTIVASTKKSSVQGHYDELPRFAGTQVATDRKGTTFYSVGAFDDVEKFVGYTQKGLGTSGEYAFISSFKDGVKVSNFTTHIGMPTYVNGLVFFNFFNELVAVTADKGSAVLKQANPCGISPNGFMFIYNLQQKAGSTPLALAAMIPVGTNNTFGLCAYSADESSTKEAWKSQITGVGEIYGITSLPHQNIFVIQAAVASTKSNRNEAEIAMNKKMTGEKKTTNNGEQNSDDAAAAILSSTFKVFDLQSGLELYSITGPNNFASIPVAAGSPSNSFLANVKKTSDSPLLFSMVAATSGDILRTCDFALLVSSVVENPKDKSLYVVGNYANRPSVLVAAKLDVSSSPTSPFCELVWETDLKFYVSSISSTIISSDILTNSTVAVVTIDGTIHSVSLEAGSTMTPSSVIYQEAPQSVKFVDRLSSSSPKKKSASLLKGLKK